jgi:NAD(P)-dependent dehydrogenase (short-subunit alcohol dehydrogenase family)
MDYRKLFDLDGRVAAVIGGGSGIGEAACLGMAAHGARVVCADRELEKATGIVQALGGGHRARWIDITNGASVREFFAQVLGDMGGLDVVVVTPAANVRKRILDYEDDEFDRVIELNLKGTFRVLREAGRIMAERGRGSLIALSSIRSQVVEPGQGVYAATKAGIVQLVRTLAAELGPAGVRVNAVAPGVVDTPLTQPIRNQPEWSQAYAEKTALRRWARMDEIAGPIVFLGSDASSYVTGSVLVVDGGWTAIDGRFTPPL